MATRRGSGDGDRFRVRPSAPKSRSGPPTTGFVSQVLKAVSKSGARAFGARGMRPASTFGRGRVAATLARRNLGANARRVIIKSRFVVLDDGMGFSLVPWRPVLEQRLGQQLIAVVRGSSVTWQVGRSRGLSLYI